MPPFALEPSDVDGFRHEWRGVHTAIRDCFARSEPREHFLRYMGGQVSPLERQAIEPLARQVEGGKMRARQRFISEVGWDEAPRLQPYPGLVTEDMGEPDGVVLFDETGFPTKGQDSVGLARQYGPGLGKGENCQVGVCGA